MGVKYTDHRNISPSFMYVWDFIYSIIWEMFPVHLRCTQHDAHDKGKEDRVPSLKFSFSEGTTASER